MKKNKLITIFVASIALFATVTSCKIASSSGGSSTPKYEYKVGDLILKDGTVVSYTESIEFTDEQKQNAVAVIFRTANGDKKALGVGVKQSSGGLAWASMGTTGYNTNFTEIQCTPYKDSSEYFDAWDSTVTFKGDADGSDNWEKICETDTKASSSKKANYPAFYYALTYGTTENLTGDYANNWFIPSIAELVEIYQSKTIINKVLNALGTDNANPLMDYLYLSSSQYYDESASAVKFNFGDGKISFGSKFVISGVRVVHAF